MKEGWKSNTLGEISISMADGPFGSNLKKEHYTLDKEVRIIQLSNIGEDGWREDNTKYTTFDHLETIKRSEVKPGNLVIAKMMPAGRAILCPDKEKAYVLSSDAVKVVLKEELLKEFILYQINSPFFRKQVYENVNGSGRVRTSLTKLRDCILQIPPLFEQQRIVSRLDASFAKIDALSKQAEEALEHAKALFQAKLKELMEKKDGWEEKKIEEVSENLDYRRKPITKGKRESGVYPYYGASGIVDYVKDYIYDEDILLVSEDGANLLARSTPIAFSVTGKVWVNNHAHVLKFDNFYTQRFVEYFFASIDISPYVTGAAQPKFNQARLNSLVVPMPPLSEQEQIVQTLDSLSQKIQQLQQNYNQTLANCQALKQALLKETFE